MNGRLLTLAAEHPDWTVRRFAEEVGCHQSYVRKTFSLYNVEVTDSRRAVTSKSHIKKEWTKVPYCGKPQTDRNEW